MSPESSTGNSSTSCVPLLYRNHGLNGAQLKIFLHSHKEFLTNRPNEKLADFNGRDENYVEGIVRLWEKARLFGDEVGEDDPVVGRLEVMDEGAVPLEDVGVVGAEDDVVLGEVFELH